jgi:hypothetical protein
MLKIQAHNEPFNTFVLSTTYKNEPINRMQVNRAQGTTKLAYVCNNKGQTHMLSTYYALSL